MFKNFGKVTEDLDVQTEVVDVEDKSTAVAATDENAGTDEVLFQAPRVDPISFAKLAIAFAKIAVETLVFPIVFATVTVGEPISHGRL